MKNLLLCFCLSLPVSVIAAQCEVSDLDLCNKAEAGDASAQIILGRMYATGDGVTQDSAKAVVWYKKAAEQGDAKAQANLGVAYENGYGVKQDYAQAVIWYKKRLSKEMLLRNIT
ncbi:tetratricopeptide repeat protein [Pseudomonas sp. F1_0610]|uniref:tetratricopeptide repeat protein n=1 Tax=Pseudomonas sp. F1_0610 TaxID=3114284 RepID=UPI0039C0BF1A